VTGIHPHVNNTRSGLKIYRGFWRARRLSCRSCFHANGIKIVYTKPWMKSQVGGNPSPILSARPFHQGRSPNPMGYKDAKTWSKIVATPAPQSPSRTAKSGCKMPLSRLNENRVLLRAGSPPSLFQRLVLATLGSMLAPQVLSLCALS
jgi:hypothetical protein